MYCIEMQLEKIIWINFIISTKIEKRMPNKGCNEISRMKLQCNNNKSWKLFWKKNPALHNLSPTLRAKIKVKIHQGCARLHCILILTSPWSSVHWGPWQESGSTVQQQWSFAPNSKNPPKISLKKIVKLTDQTCACNWMWSARNDRKRKFCEIAESC